MSQNHLTSPEELLRYQLRTARTMEDDSLAALGELAEAAVSTDVTKLFTHHADETREQIENLNRVFQLLELPASSAASPSTKGISRQAESLIRRSDASLHDRITLAAALGNEHYEISAYQALIIATEAMGATDAAALLRENLDQEQHTSEELRERLQELG